MAVAFAVPAIAGALSVSTATATAVAVGVDLAISVGLNMIAASLAPDPTVEPQTGGMSDSTSIDPTHPRMLVVGRCKTAGSLLYQQVSDIRPSGEQAPKRNNRYLDQVIALADHPCEGLVAMRTNGENTPLGALHATMGYRIPKFEKGGGDHHYVRFFNGAAGQSADPRLIAAAPGNDWTSKNKLTGVAYARATSLYDEDVWDAWPDMEFILDGALFYDHRKDSTVSGGSGTQRLANPATWAHTENPGVMAGHLLRGYRVAGSHFAGVQGGTAADIDIASFQAAATACEDLITRKDGSQERRYRIGGEFAVDEPLSDILETMVAAMAGRLCHTGYSWRLFAGVEQSIAAYITDADLVITQERDRKPKFGLADAVNAVFGEYMEPDEGWSMTAAPPRISPADEALDGNRQLALRLSFPMVTSQTQVQRLMEIARRQARRQDRRRICLPPKFVRLEVGDWISWTSTKWGGGARTFWVEAIEASHDLNIFVSLAETAPEVFAHNAAADELPKRGRLLPGVTPPDNSDEPTFTMSLYRIQGARGQVRPGVQLLWDPVAIDNPRIRTVQVRFRPVGQTRWKTDAASYLSDDVTVDGTWQSPPLLPDTLYEFGMRWRYSNGKTSAWSAMPAGSPGAYQITTGGFRPADLPVPNLSLTTGVAYSEQGEKGDPWVLASWSNSNSAVRAIEIRHRVMSKNSAAAASWGDWIYEITRNTDADGDGQRARLTKHIKQTSQVQVQARFLSYEMDPGDWSSAPTITTPATPPPAPPAAVITGTPTTGIIKKASTGVRRPYIRFVVGSNADVRIRAVRVRYRATAQSGEAANNWMAVRFDYSPLGVDRTYDLIAGLDDGTQYEWQAQFLTNDGDACPWSTVQTITTPNVWNAAEQPAPTGTLSAGVDSGGSGSKRGWIKGDITDPADPRATGIWVAWRVTSLTGERFEKQFFTRKDGASEGNSFDFKLTGLMRNTEYTVRAAFAYRTGDVGAWVTMPGITTLNVGDTVQVGDLPEITEEMVSFPAGENLIRNPSFEAVVDAAGSPMVAKGWSAGASTGFAVVNDVAGASEGRRYLRRTGTGNGTYNMAFKVPCGAGDKWRIACDLRGSSGAAFTRAGLRVRYFTTSDAGADSGLGNNTDCTVATVGTAWGKVAASLPPVPYADAVYMLVDVYITGQTAGTVCWDKLRLVLLRDGDELDDLASAKIGGELASAVKTNANSAKARTDALTIEQGGEVKLRKAAKVEDGADDLQTVAAKATRGDSVVVQVGSNVRLRKSTLVEDSSDDLNTITSKANVGYGLTEGSSANRLRKDLVIGNTGKDLDGAQADARDAREKTDAWRGTGGNALKVMGGVLAPLTVDTPVMTDHAISRTYSDQYAGTLDWAVGSTWRALATVNINCPVTSEVFAVCATHLQHDFGAVMEPCSLRITIDGSDAMMPDRTFQVPGQGYFGGGLFLSWAYCAARPNISAGNHTVTFEVRMTGSGGRIYARSSSLLAIVLSK